MSDVQVRVRCPGSCPHEPASLRSVAAAAPRSSFLLLGRGLSVNTQGSNLQSVRFMTMVNCKLASRDLRGIHCDRWRGPEVAPAGSRPWRLSAITWDMRIKKPSSCERGLFINKIWRLPTLPHCGAVPSAMGGLTCLFGMGRGGDTPGKTTIRS